MQREVLWEGETRFGHYQVVDGLYDGRPARVLYSGDRQAAQSGVAKDDEADLLFDYNQRLFELIISLVPNELLIIGGGVATLPKALLAALPDLAIDVVEPDERLTGLAYDYFDLPHDTRLRFFHTNGRSFLRSNPKRYDMIVVDAFTHTTIPAELRTLEAFQAYHGHLRAKGLLAMNVISGYHGPAAQTLREVYGAACRTFDVVDIFLASRGYSLWLPQNFVLAAQKDTDYPLKDYVRYGPVQPPEVNPDGATREGQR